MIKGKAKIEFGSGDIRLTSVLSSGIGAVVLENQQKHEIGENITVSDEWTTESASIIISFTDARSIDVLIKKLQEARGFMNGIGINENIDNTERVNLDKFMKNKVLLIKEESEG